MDDGALRAPGPTTVSATTNNHPYHFVPTRASSRTYNLILFLHAGLVLSNPEIGWSLKDDDRRDAAHKHTTYL
jgi:hypothetical protein